MNHNNTTQDMEIVEFSDHSYGLRMKWRGDYRFKDLRAGLTLHGYWWTSDGIHFEDCKGTLATVRGVLETLQDGERRPPAPPAPLDNGRPISHGPNDRPTLPNVPRPPQPRLQDSFGAPVTKEKKGFWSSLFDNSEL